MKVIDPKENRTALIQDRFCIDKSDVLQQRLEEADSVYIEGAAASGKTTAVKMLLARKPELKYAWFDFSEEKSIKERLEEAAAGECGLFVFDRMDLCAEKDILCTIASLIRKAGNRKVILISREKPDFVFVKLIWEGKIKMVHQQLLSFTLDDIRELAKMRGVFINPKELLEVSGGWPGCVSLFLDLMADVQDHQTGRSDQGRNKNDTRGPARAHPIQSRNLYLIRHRYEIDIFIKKELLGSLCGKETVIMQCAMACPWISEEMCAWCLKIGDAAEHLEDLRRKGMLQVTEEKKYRASGLFRSQILTEPVPWDTYSEWYSGQRCFRESYYCLYHKVFGFQEQKDRAAGIIQNPAAFDQLIAFAGAYYEYIPYLGLDYSFILRETGNSCQFIYLRGMYKYQARDFSGFHEELRKASKLKGHDGQEVYLNLLYTDVNTPARIFMERAEAMFKAEKGKTFRIFSMEGFSFSYLCGLRDISALFACPKKEENRYDRIWSTVFGEKEYLAYRMARLEYYLETKRAGRVRNEIFVLLNGTAMSGLDSDSLRLHRLYLLCRLQKGSSDEEYMGRVEELKECLLENMNDLIADQAELLYDLYVRGESRLELAAAWVRDYKNLMTEKINESNFTLFFGFVKAQIMLHRYESALTPAQRLAEYLDAYKRSRFLAEALFMLAIIRFQIGEKGAALRNTIESFAAGGGFRYVTFYSDYEAAGNEVLSQYMEWYEAQKPNIWQRKRKYDYRNVLNMPEADYLNVIASSNVRKDKGNSTKDYYGTENLTMTEMVVLQSLSRGLSNEQIAAELNLKITTVKSHLYSIYKKLGVRNRMEAIIKGKDIKVTK